MRIVVFYIKEMARRIVLCLTAVRAHVTKSFYRKDKSESLAYSYGLLDVISWDIENICPKIAYEPAAKIENNFLVTIEPSSGFAPSLTSSRFSHFPLVISRLDVLLATLRAFLQVGKGSMVIVIAHMSQMSCRKEASENAISDDLYYCQQSCLAQALVEIKSISQEGDLRVVIIDQRELLGYKNSALFERLFFSKNNVQKII